MKRFTETEKWKDSWFIDLEPVDKLLWIYMLDNCNNAGVLDINWKMLSFMMDRKIDSSYFEKVFEGKVYKINATKYWIINFIKVQYGELNGNNFPHKAVLRCLKDVDFCTFDVVKKNKGEIYSNICLTLPTTHSQDSSRVPSTLLGRVPTTHKEKEEEKEKEKDKEMEKEKEEEMEKEMHRKKPSRKKTSTAKKIVDDAFFDEIVDFWNNLNLIRYDKEKDKMREVEKHLAKTKYTLPELVEAMRNYSETLGRKDTWWNQKYNLALFLGRKAAIEYFYPGNYVYENLTDSKNKSRAQIKQDNILNIENPFRVNKKQNDPNTFEASFRREVL